MTKRKDKRDDIFKYIKYIQMCIIYIKQLSCSIYK